ncbi:SDR family oxidoreductase [Paraburkholderia sp. C35]|uniref:SDR family oxidoreductase n=1 Tax=Paraburkholderia sp. C35 TaxID=2126993 RepID=UPI000D68F34A|nr:SDR family oxidoreductase [Paraburkholderia sp. C35]
MDVQEKKKVALVTNASDYAGQPAVTALTSAGYHVLVGDESFNDESVLAKFLEKHAGVVRVGGENPEQIVEAAWAVHGRVDAIVSNDHFPAVHRATADVSLDDMRATLEKLVINPFALVKASIPRFKEQGGGNIVMITSCRTKLPMYGGAVPDAARDAANALVRSFSIELAPLNIAVNAVAPNFLYSEAYYPRAIFIDDPMGREYVKASVPAGRLGDPEEIGELITFLASTQSRFLTGAIVDFSGGWPAAATRPSNASD